VIKELSINNPNDIKDSIYSNTTNFNQLVGGNNQEWRQVLKKIGQKPVECVISPVGEAMRDLEYVIKNVNRLNCPITLNPQDSTFLDVAAWSYFQKRLSISTIEKRLRYARFMENHAVSVDFRNPNYPNFRRHMDYREEIEKASPNALVHEWKTMRMFLEAYGISIWPYKPPIAPKHKKRNLPFPDVVRQFFFYDYSDNLYERALYQYLFYHSFLIGWRVPSEICEMTLNDVIIDSKGRGSITITETKKRKSQRTVLPESFILSSQSHKSLKNWIDKWRPKVENQYSGDALYLQPSGKPFTVRHLGHKLSKHGKRIWPYFRPYDMRHWCAVARLIETKIKTGGYDVFTVKYWLGHEDQETTDHYIHFAEQYYNQYPKSWIHDALRSHNFMRGQHQGKTRVWPNKATLLSFSPRRKYGPAEI